MATENEKLPMPLQLLARGVPITLLCDLVAVVPCTSRDIYRTEGGGADWLHHAA